MLMKKHKQEQIVEVKRGRSKSGNANGKSTLASQEGEITVWDVLPLEERVRRPEAGSSKTDERVGARERGVESV